MDKHEFLNKFGISMEEFEQTGLDWHELDLIKQDHAKNTGRLDAAVRYVAERLRTLAEVHTVRTRIKDPDHLIAKIIRKKLMFPETRISAETYQNIITDLAGVRALHLFKEDWESIHDFVIRTWDLNEGAVASICEGDHEGFVSRFRERGCTIQSHPFGYRSVHYLVSFSPSKAESTIVEIQVRTILEEAWSEIDHLIRYPYGNNKQTLSPYLLFLNRLLGNADEMGSFIRLLSDNLTSAGKQKHAKPVKDATLAGCIRRDLRGLPVEMKVKKLLEERMENLETHLASLRTMPQYDSVADAFTASARENRQFPHRLDLDGRAAKAHMISTGDQAQEG